MRAASAIGPAGDQRCWELVDLDAKPEGGDDPGAPHHASVDAAWEAYRVMCAGRDPDGPPGPALMPQQLDYVCLTAVAVCGTVFVDREYEWTVHHPDRDQLLADALADGWTLLEDGSMTCAGCEHCAAVLAGLQPPPPVLPGQLDLFGDGGPA
jgi:hypothetical protein